MTQIRKMPQQVMIARYMLLGTVIATVVNFILLLTDSDKYIPYSASVAYYLGYFGWLFDGARRFGVFTAVGMTLAAFVLSVYVVSWVLAAKNLRWLQVGMWLVIADAAALVGLILLFRSNFMNFAWELALHGAVIYEMATGISAWKKLTNESEDG